MTTRKTGAPKKAATKPKVTPTVAHIVDTDDPEKAERTYADLIDGWADMTKAQKDELVALAISYRKMPQPLAVSLDKSASGQYSIGIAPGSNATHHALKMAETFASGSMSFANDRLSDLINHFISHNNRGASETDINSVLAFVAGAKPQNEVEATLAIQMAVTNDAAMRALRMVGKADWVPQTQMFGNLAVKLLRTFTAQAEALAKLQRGGEQVVRHIHVDNRGGQAVIAENVHTGGKENGRIDDQSHAAGTAGIGTALLGADPFGNGMPIPSREGKAEMQDARWDESGSAGR